MAAITTNIKLRRPAMIGGVEVSQMTMREPTVADQLVAQKQGGDDGDREVALIANLCECTGEDIRNLPAPDFVNLQKAYAGFFD